MSHDLYRDVYLQIRARTCATVSEAKDAADAIITRLFVENQRLRAETGQHRIDLEEYRRDVESLMAERDRLKAEVEALVATATATEAKRDL